MDSLEQTRTEEMTENMTENSTEYSTDNSPEYRTESSHDTEKLMKQIDRYEKGFKNYHWFLIYLVIFLLVVWILFFKIIGITHMPNLDMTPRVDGGDLLIFYRLDKDASFQEVVVFEKKIPDETKKRLMVGCVIGAPGDTIDISESNRPIVNGNVLMEDMIFYDTPKRDERVNYPITLGEDEYFILVDNRKEGLDSRYFGPVKKKELLGTVINVIRRNKL
ncbi:MAG: signal peptidase I [Lachnospiraceae bacterium]|nr:signal peptidase I [Lachnospiraceae bacterium]